jgi:hypothetical protein
MKKNSNGTQPFRGQGGPATGGAYSIEPHIAERVFDEMASEAKVTVWRNARLKSVTKASGRECENLFVTFALSASHSAFASIRMEPVFMVISQSAATAACLAIDQGTAVQQVKYDELQKRLLAAGQVLEWPPESEGRMRSDGIVFAMATDLRRPD